MSSVIAKNLDLFNLRKVRGWDQTDVAMKLGIPLLTYARIEQGKSRGKTDVWLAIQKLYDIPDSKMWQIVKKSI